MATSKENPMGYHPELIAEALDALAGATEPLSSRMLSSLLTGRLRRRVARGDFTEADVMTRKVNSNYYEVSGSDVSRMLDSLPGESGVVMLGVKLDHKYGGRAKFYALRANVEEWNRKHVAVLDAAYVADERYEITEYGPTVSVTDASLAGTEVATFNVDVLGRDYAIGTAERVKRHLVAEAAKAVKCE